MSEERYAVVLVTAGNVEEARKIAESIVSQNLAACCNIVPQIESIYRWEGKIEKDAETLMIIKTRKSHEKKLIDKIKELHSYDVPEIIFLPIEGGNTDYLKWIGESTSGK